MKNIIRITSLLLCIILALGCFTACQQSTEDQTDEPSTEEATEPIVIELGAVIDKAYTIVEIDRTKGTCLALLLEDENSYRDGTYSQGREYDIDSHELLREIRYTRDSKSRLTRVVYTDPKTQDTLETEEYSYTPDGRPLSSVSRDAQGITINSVAYTYNTDGTYLITTSEDSRLVSIVTYDRTDKVTARTDYEYKDDGSYTTRNYADGKLTQLTEFAPDGTESNRSVYTYNTDGTFSVSQYENGILKNQQTGTAEEIVTLPPETTTQEEKETLDTNANITVPTEPVATTPNESPTNKNDNPVRPNTTTTTTTTEPATDSSGNIDMLAQSRIFRSGEYCLIGEMEEGGEIMYMTIAVTRNTIYTSMEVDFGKMMGGTSTGTTELGFLKTADGTAYMLETTSKTYCSMDESLNLGGENLNPGEMFEELDMSEAFIPVSEYAQPDKTEQTIVNGEMVTCYTFNTTSGESVKHYVDDNGQLIRVEDYNASGNMIQIFDVNNLTGNIPEYMKKIPSDYTKTDLTTMIIAMLGNPGTII